MPDAVSNQIIRCVFVCVCLLQTGLSGNIMILAVLYKGGLLMASQHMTVGELSSFLMYTFWVGISIAGKTSTQISSSALFASVRTLFVLMWWLCGVCVVCRSELVLLWADEGFWSRSQTVAAAGQEAWVSSKWSAHTLVILPWEHNYTEQNCFIIVNKYLLDHYFITEKCMIGKFRILVSTLFLLHDVMFTAKSFFFLSLMKNKILSKTHCSL